MTDWTGNRLDHPWLVSRVCVASNRQEEDLPCTQKPHRLTACQQSNSALWLQLAQKQLKLCHSGICCGYRGFLNVIEMLREHLLDVTLKFKHCTRIKYIPIFLSAALVQHHTVLEMKLYFHRGETQRQTRSSEGGTGWKTEHIQRGRKRKIKRRFEQTNGQMDGRIDR